MRNLSGSVVGTQSSHQYSARAVRQYGIHPSSEKNKMRTVLPYQNTQNSGRCGEIYAALLSNVLIQAGTI
jgi:hypothetical protein